MRNKSSRRELSTSISRLVPKVIGGAQLSFMSEKAVTHCQFHVLMTIYATEGVSIRDLSKKHHVKMPTATGIVGRLEKAGMARRARPEHDRRKVTVYLTPQGVSFIHRFQSSIARRWEGILSFLDEKDVSDYRRIVDRIEDHFKRGEQV